MINDGFPPKARGNDGFKIALLHAIALGCLLQLNNHLRGISMLGAVPTQFHAMKVYVSGSSDDAISVEKFILIKMNSLLYCACTFGSYALHTRLSESSGDMEKWQKFIADVAIQSLQPLNTPENIKDTPITANFGEIPVTLAVAQEASNSVALMAGAEQEILAEISLDTVLNQLRSSMIEHEIWNSCDAYTNVVMTLKKYAILVDLAAGLLNSKEVPATRKALFITNCEDIYKALIPVLKKPQSDPITITLSDHTHLILTPTESSVTLTVEEHQVTLAMSLNAFFDHLRHQIVKGRDYCHPSKAKLRQSFRQFGWKGKLYLYHASYPCSAELAPDYKSQPYKTVKGKPPYNFNGRVNFTGTTEKIVCRDYSADDAVIRLKKNDGIGKRDLSVNSTPQSIAANIKLGIREIYSQFRANAKRYDIINNDEFGQFLVACFLDMQEPEKNETLRIMLIKSTWHSMDIRLRIKGTVDKPIYVVSFFDPYFTTKITRCRTTDLSILKAQTLELYINGKISKKLKQDNSLSLYELYYEGQAPISVVMELNLACLSGNVGNTEKKLSSFACDPLTSAHLFHLLELNLSFDLANLQNKLNEIGRNSLDEMIELLSAKNKSGMPGIYMALQEGHAEVIKAYSKLLRLVPKTERCKLVELLAAKDEYDTPGLFMALQNGHAGAIKAYGKLLRVLPKNERYHLVKLLAANDADGTSGLYMALQDGHAEAIKAYGELFQLLPKTERYHLVELLATKDEQGTFGICMALYFEYAEAVKAYGELLQFLSKAERNKLFDLLTAAVTNRNGDKTNIKVRKELLQWIAKWRAYAR